MQELHAVERARDRQTIRDRVTQLSLSIYLPTYCLWSRCLFLTKRFALLLILCRPSNRKYYLHCK